MRKKRQVKMVMQEGGIQILKDVKLPKIERRPKLYGGGTSKLSTNDMVAMVLDYNAGMTVTAIAEKYDVSRATVYRVFKQAEGWR